jgi:uncharacterized integral membrane protein
MELKEVSKSIYWLWTMYITWGLIVQSVVAFLILFINTCIMGQNKDKTVQSHWAANVSAIVFYILAIISGLILYYFPANAIQAKAVETVAKAFE